MFQFNFFNNNPSRAGKHKCTNTLYVYCHLCGAWESLEQMYLCSVFSIGTVAIIFKFLVLFQRSQKLSNFMLMFVFYSFGYQLIMSDQFGFYVLFSGTSHRTFIVLEFKTQCFPLSFSIRTIFVCFCELNQVWCHFLTLLSYWFSLSNDVFNVFFLSELAQDISQRCVFICLVEVILNCLLVLFLCLTIFHKFSLKHRTEFLFLSYNNSWVLFFFGWFYDIELKIVCDLLLRVLHVYIYV